MKRWITVSAVFALASMGAWAQNPLTKDTKQLYSAVKRNIVRSAEKMPEENYSFKPTPEVRSFGALIGHVADAQYEFCSPIKGEKKELNIEHTKTSKADLIAALNQAFAYCDAVYDATTDANAAQQSNFFGSNWTRLGLLNFNNAHDNEHYGNIVTYMRMKNLVPPSSERSR